MCFQILPLGGPNNLQQGAGGGQGQGAAAKARVKVRLAPQLTEPQHPLVFMFNSLYLTAFVQKWCYVQQRLHYRKTLLALHCCVVVFTVCHPTVYAHSVSRLHVSSFPLLIQHSVSQEPLPTNPGPKTVFYLSLPTVYLLFIVPSCFHYYLMYLR